MFGIPPHPVPPPQEGRGRCRSLLATNAAPSSSSGAPKGQGQAAVTTLLTYVLGLADDALILGHRLSEWSGHAPMLEEDIALSNLALDLIGQARLLYAYAGEVEGEGRDEDAFTYL